MADEKENWRKQAFADLGGLWDRLDELNEVADKIDKALDEDDYELYQQVIAGLTEEEKE